MIDPRLLIPLVPIPDMIMHLPRGAPVEWNNQAWIYVGKDTRGHYHLVPDDDNERWVREEWGGISLDLSPPPLVNGWPTRVDAYPVVEGMLKQALGLSSTCAFAVAYSTTGDAVLAFFERRELTVRVFSSIARTDGVHVPAIADINPADPLADRLALRALVMARVWEEK